MRPTLRRHRSFLVVAALLVLPLLFLYGAASGRESSDRLARLVHWVTGPVQSTAVRAWRAVARTGDAYLWLVGVADENQRLRHALAMLHAERAALDETVRENQRLRRLLGLERGLPGTRSVVARVIGFGQSPSYRTLRIDRGTRDGVQRRAGVITADGVVGRVVVASAGYADVLLLSDAGMRLDVIGQRSRAHGVLRGAAGRCRLDAMDRTLDLVAGDVLVTSGLDGSFPRGVPVGTVREVTRPPMGLYLDAQVEPHVAFARLEEVAVLLQAPAEVAWPALGGTVDDRVPEPEPDPSPDAAAPVPPAPAAPAAVPASLPSTTPATAAPPRSQPAAAAPTAASAPSAPPSPVPASVPSPVARARDAGVAAVGDATPRAPAAAAPRPVADAGRAEDRR